MGSNLLRDMCGGMGAPFLGSDDSLRSQRSLYGLVDDDSWIVRSVLGATFHAQCITWPVHGRVVSLPWRCSSHVGATLGQLYVDVSRVGLDDSQVWRDFTGSWAGI